MLTVETYPFVILLAHYFKALHILNKHLIRLNILSF